MTMPIEREESVDTGDDALSILRHVASQDDLSLPEAIPPAVARVLLGEIEQLRARLSALESAATDALAILDGCGSGDPDEWEDAAERLRAALNPEEAR